MPPTNRAAYLPSKSAHPFTISPAPMPDPGTSLLTIHVAAIAINPADSVMQALGVLIPSYPAILGCDAAGTVTAVGSEVTTFAVGDRVTGFCDHLGELGGRGTFQEYCNVRAELTAKVPEGVGLREACVLPAGVSTAAFGLFEKSALGLDLPPGDGRRRERRGEVVVVWGASASVGCCAVMLAKAAGYDVAAVAGGRNRGLVEGLGADWVFDYGREGVVEDVVKALEGRKCVGAFNAVMPEDTYVKCAEIVHRLGGTKMVASVFPASMETNRNLPHGVKFADNSCYDIMHSDVGPAIFGKWITAALAQGTLMCKPDPVVVGHGLEYCQEGCDRVKSASGQKFVVSLQ